MDVVKKVLNVFGIIFGVIFSCALVLSLVVTPALSGATKFFKTENLRKIVTEIDFAALVQDSMESTSAEETEMIDLLFEEGIMDEFLGLYVEDLFAELDGDPGAKKLTAETATAIFADHIDVFVEMAKAQMDEETLQYVSDQEIADMLKENLAAEAQGMVDSFPSLYDLGLDEETLNVMGIFRDGLVGIVGIVMVAIFAIIVFICQFPRFKSFMWLGVDFLIGGGLAFVVASSLEAIFKIAAASIPFGNMIMDPIVGTFAGAMKTGALIELGLAVLFIVIFIVGRVLLKKKVTPQVA